MEDETGLQTKVLWLICTVFVVIAVSYGVSVISDSKSNASNMNSSSWVVTEKTAQRAKLLSNSSSGDDLQENTTGDSVLESTTGDVAQNNATGNDSIIIEYKRETEISDVNITDY